MSQSEQLPEASHDEVLIRAFQAGSSSAFDELYRMHHVRVRAVARRYLRDPRDVEEAVQDTFVKAFKALPRFNGNFRTGAWLGRIAVNTAIDISRKNVRRPELSVLEGHEGGSTAGADEMIVGSGPDVEAALLRIPPVHARALRLRALEAASHEEIAAELGGTASQAKALLHRARQSFKAAWREIGSGAAFVLMAGVVALWMRLTRTVAALSPTAAGVQGASGGSGDALAAPLVAIMERL